MMDNNNWRPAPTGVGGASGGGADEQPVPDGDDWRKLLPQESRQQMVNKIMETLKRHLPFSGPEGLHELRKIAVRFEEKIFHAAVNQPDYLQKISSKMLTMDNNSWRPAPPGVGGAGGGGGAGEQASPDSDDWRKLLPLESRQRIVDKIMETLKRHLPFSGLEGLHELRKIAVVFEEKIFHAAVNQPDYLRKISSEMLTMDNNSWRPAPPGVSGAGRGGGGASEQPFPDSDDWRKLLPQESRQWIVDKIMETLKRHLPFSGLEGLRELRKIAVRFEDKIFHAAVNQPDYLRKISLKMLAMENESQNSVAYAMPTGSAGNSS